MQLQDIPFLFNSSFFALQLQDILRFGLDKLFGSDSSTDTETLEDFEAILGESKNSCWVETDNTVAPLNAMS